MNGRDMFGIKGCIDQGRTLVYSAKPSHFSLHHGGILDQHYIGDVPSPYQREAGAARAAGG